VLSELLCRSAKLRFAHNALDRTANGLNRRRRSQQSAPGLALPIDSPGSCCYNKANVRFI
jgi:hypothetical protein